MQDAAGSISAIMFPSPLQGNGLLVLAVARISVSIAIFLLFFFLEEPEVCMHEGSSKQTDKKEVSERIVSFVALFAFPSLTGPQVLSTFLFLCSALEQILTKRPSDGRRFKWPLHSQKSHQSHPWILCKYSNG